MLWTGPILTFALVSIHAAAQTFSGEATYYQTGVGACGKPGYVSAFTHRVCLTEYELRVIYILTRSVMMATP